MVKISGRLKRILWQSLDTDFVIVCFSSINQDFEFIATGDFINPINGLIYNLSGQWTIHPAYNKQLKIESCCLEP